MARMNDTRAEETREPVMPFLPFVESATRGHSAERYEGEDHARWLMSLERRLEDPVVGDPNRPSVPPELSINDDIVGPDLE